MNKDLQIMADGRQREADQISFCVKELSLTVQRLIDAGQTYNSIIAALAHLSVTTVDDGSNQQRP